MDEEGSSASDDESVSQRLNMMFEIGIFVICVFVLSSTMIIENGLFVNNIADEEGYMSAYSTQNVHTHWGERAYALRSNPRAVGVSFAANF